jgi:hypothetical protein
VTPEQFWNLHPWEFWLLVQANTPKKYYGKLSEDEAAELYQEVQEHEGKKKALERLTDTTKTRLSVEIT